MKRVISALTSAAMIISTAACLAGCDLKTFFTGEGSATTVFADEVITNGEWLAMINEAFGMQADENSEDDDIDIARAWNVIGKDEEIDKDAIATEKFLTSTLVRASGMVGANATDEEIAGAAVEHGLVSPGSSLTDTQNAAEALENAKEQWSNQTFDSLEDIKYNEGVQDFSDEKALENIKVSASDSTAVIPADYAELLTEGSVYVLPSNAENPNGVACKVVSVEDNGDGTCTVKNAPAEINEVYDSIHVAGNFGTDCAQFEPADDVTVVNDFSDDDEYWIDGVSKNSVSDEPSILNLAYSEPEAYLQQLYSKTTETALGKSFDFNSDNDLKVKVGNNDYSIGIHIGNIVMRSDIDIDFGLFDTEVNRIYYALDYDTEVSFRHGVSLKSIKNDYAPEILQKIMGTKDDKCNLSKELGRIKIPVCTGISVDLSVTFSISASGAIQVKITQSNSKGFEITSSGCRSINETKTDTEISITGVFFPNLRFAVSLSILAFKDVVSLGISVGPEFKSTLTLHEEDVERSITEEESGTEYNSKQRDAMICADITGMLQIKGNVVVDLKLFKVDYLLFKLDKNSSPWVFFSAHSEDFELVPQCTWKHRGETTSAVTETTTTGAPAENIPEGKLSFQKSYISLNQGVSSKISLASVPAGTDVSKLVWKSSNPSVVTVDSVGNINAVASGAATITVSTADGKNVASCAVSVAGSFSSELNVRETSQTIPPNAFEA